MGIQSIFILMSTLIIISELVYGAELSYNLPNLSACAQWNPNATTLVLKSSQILQPWDVFVDKNNTVYVTDMYKNHLYVWFNGDSNSTKTIFNGLQQPSGLIVLSTADVFVANGDGRVKKLKTATDSFETNAQFCQGCAEIFIDINNLMYCSMNECHQIVATPLESNSNVLTVVAGVGIQGSDAHMLHNPGGIWVNTNLDLYVADSKNDRIQLFRPNTINGITIAGASSILTTITLLLPSSVILDANNFIYITDYGHNRIIAETVYGFQCIVGCSQIEGILSNKLPYPINMAFDSFGNMYVTALFSQHVNKFLLLKNKCDSPNKIKFSTTFTIATSTTSLFTSIYNSKLSADSSTYMQQCNGPLYSYESIPLRVSTKGYYNLVISGTEGINVQVYKNYFNPLTVDINPLLYANGKCITDQIKFTMNLLPDEIYYLIVATTYLNVTVSYSVNSTGPSSLSADQSKILKYVQTKYSSNLTTNSHKCNHKNCRQFNFYCEIIKINTRQTGYYTIISDSTMDMFGYVYENNFTLFDLAINAIKNDDDSHCNKQFKITLYCPINTSFILVVTTNQKLKHGVFSVIVNGPSNVSMKQIDHIEQNVQSNYSSALSNQSQKLGHHNCKQIKYYYEALKIDVNTSGYYMFSSSSILDTYGYLYKYPFDPYNSVNTSLSANDDTCEDGNFTIIAYLQINITYVLVITTSYKLEPILNERLNISRRKIELQGLFSVITHGIDRINIKRIDDFTTRTTIVQSVYSSQFTENSSQYNHKYCYSISYYYEYIQIDVSQFGNYTFSSISRMNTFGYLYKQHFNPHSSTERLLFYDDDGCSSNQFKITAELESNVTYILFVSESSMFADKFLLLISGPNNVTFNKISLQKRYSSELTEESQVYPRVCGKGNYHYETIEIYVQQDGSYTFDSNTNIELYGYIYRNDFDPSYPNKNLLAESNFSCGEYFKVGSYFEVNTIYILVVTTTNPDVRGNFTLLVTGPNNVTLNRINKKRSNCVVGDQCNLFTKGIGLTINDILRNKIKSKTSFGKQSVFVKTAAGITMIMFVIGLINGFFSFITFQNKDVRKVGCGLYLLASSITSLLTITMFTIKFWFTVFIQLHSTVSSSILQADCVFIGPFLKLCLCLDGWLNACVAIEGTVNVSKGVTFNKEMSKRAARWIIFMLPILIVTTIIHEPINHDLFSHITQKYKSINSNSTGNMLIETEHNIMCVIRYSRSVQTYNTVTLFFHLIVPFVVNLCSALFIIFGTARQKAATQKKHTFKEHALKQMNEHKQLLISPIILLVLAVPRLIISLMSGCVDPSNNPWLYFCAYFISYLPPMLVFIVFVLPSELYKKIFSESMARWRRSTHQ